MSSIKHVKFKKQYIIVNRKFMVMCWDVNNGKKEEKQWENKNDLVEVISRNAFQIETNDINHADKNICLLSSTDSYFS